MASPFPQFYPNCPLSGGLGEETLLVEQLLAVTSPLGGTSSSETFPRGGVMLGDENLFPPYLHNGGSNIDGEFQMPDLSEFAEECCGYIPGFNPIIPIIRENREIKSNQAPEAEDTAIKVERYSIEEKKDIILRYLSKRSKRNFNKTIKYACRKTLADRRVRVRGRFARNNELMCEDDIRMKKNDNALKVNGTLYKSDTLLLKSDDEDWLQVAMESLMYIPYISG